MTEAETYGQARELLKNSGYTILKTIIQVPEDKVLGLEVYCSPIRIFEETERIKEIMGGKWVVSELGQEGIGVWLAGGNDEKIYQDSGEKKGQI